MCCLVVLFGKCGAYFTCLGDGANELTCLDAGSSWPLPPIMSPVAIAEDVSSNFIRTAKIERAAVNGSFELFLSVLGKDIPKCLSMG